MYLLASTMYDECMAELMMRHSLFLFFFGRYKHCIFALLTDDALATARCATTPVLSGTQAYIHCMRVASGLVAGSCPSFDVMMQQLAAVITYICLDRTHDRVSVRTTSSVLA